MARRPRAGGRLRVDQHLQAIAHCHAVWRLQGERHRSREGPSRPATLQPGQERFLRHAQQADGAVRRRIDIRLQPNRKEQENDMKIKRTLIAGLAMAVASTDTANVAAQSWPDQKVKSVFFGMHSKPMAL